MSSQFPSDIGDFVIGFSPIGLSPELSVPTGKIIPSYLYIEYNDDDSLQAFTSSYNAQAQTYLDWFNDINLPIYTAGSISGSILDWVAEGLYGLARPGLPTFGSGPRGPFNTYDFNFPGMTFNGYIPAVGQTYYQTSDDTFKRVLTWLFYKGDGKIFNIRWLKRRVERFLNGTNGTDYNIDQTYSASVSQSGYDVTITVPNSAEATIFKAAVLAGVLELPFQFTWTINLV